MATYSSCCNCLKQLLSEEDCVTSISNNSKSQTDEQDKGQDDEFEQETDQPSGPSSSGHHHHHNHHQETLELSVVTLSQSGEIFEVDAEEAQQLIDSGVLRIETMDSSSTDPAAQHEEGIQLPHLVIDEEQSVVHQKDKVGGGGGGGGGRMDNVPVVEALSVIFGIPLDPATESGGGGGGGVSAWRKGDGCVLCHKCGQVVSILYSGFQEFNSLSVEESYVSKGIKHFLNKINSLNRLSLQQQGQCQLDQGPPDASASKDETRPTTARKAYTKKQNNNNKGRQQMENIDKSLPKMKKPAKRTISSEGVKSRKRSKLLVKEEQEDSDEDDKLICAPNISDVSSDSNSLSDLKHEVTEEGTTTVRTTRTSARRRVAKKQLSDYEELESSEDEVPPETTFDDGDDEEEDPNFDAQEEIEDIKVTQEDVQLRRLVQVLEYKEEDLQVDSDGKFICPECKKTYVGLKTLNKHVLIHKLKKAPNNCPQCNIQFESLDELHLHVTSTHSSSRTTRKAKRLPGRPPRKNNTATTTTRPVERLKQRGIKANQPEDQNDGGPVPCLICHKQFASSNLLMRHEKDVHEEKEILDYFCPTCGEIFSSLEPLSTHFSEIHHEKLNFCTQCGKSFIKSKFLVQHLKETHQIASENITVEQLSHDGGDEELEVDYEMKEEKFDPLREPGERIKKSDPTPYKCPHCHKEYRRKKQLDIHILFHNGEEPQHECEHCTKRFFQLKGLKRHLLLHTTDSPHICEQCDRIFAKAELLKRHMEAIHHHNSDNNEVKGRQKKKSNKKKGPGGSSTSRRSNKDTIEHKCTDCDKTFTRKEYLRLHQRIHTGEKPYECSFPLCNKTFRDPRNLQQHLVTHTTDRPFCCSICGLTFKRAHHLNDHEGTHREDVVRPFVCSLANCSKAFKLKKHLISHELVHSGSKDHQCETCGKAFNRKDNLRQHVNKVHGKESTNFSDLIRVTNNEVPPPQLVQVQQTPTPTLVPVSAITDNNTNITTIQILPTAVNFTYTTL